MRVVPDLVHFLSGYEHIISVRKVKFSSDQILNLKLFLPLIIVMACFRSRHWLLLMISLSGYKINSLAD